MFFLKGIFSFFFLCALFNTASSPDSTVSEDAGVEPRTVATLALTARRSNHLARSHSHFARSHSYLASSHPHLARSHPHLARSHIYMEMLV